MLKRRFCILLSLLLVFSLLACDPVKDDVSGESGDISGVIQSELTVRFLNVGQGDCTLLTLPDGGFVLIDAGVYTNKKAVTNYLEKYGVETIEYMVLTHFDADHIGVAAEVIEAFEVKNVIMPDTVATTATYDNLLTSLENHEEIKVIKGEAGYTFLTGIVKFEILSPFETEGKSSNQCSVVMLMSYKNIKMLFMGDAEKPNETEMLNNYTPMKLRADIIKLGHHGSASSGSKDFLEAVAPKYGVISCGKDNSYKHPAEETINTLEELNITYFRTDLHGTVTGKTDGKNLNIHTEG